MDSLDMEEQVAGHGRPTGQDSSMDPLDMEEHVLDDDDQVETHEEDINTEEGNIKQEDEETVLEAKMAALQQQLFKLRAKNAQLEKTQGSSSDDRSTSAGSVPPLEHLRHVADLNSKDLKEENKQVGELVKLLVKIGNEDTLDKLVYSLRVTTQGSLAKELRQPNNKTDDKWQEDPNNICTLTPDQKILERARIKLKNAIDLATSSLLFDLRARDALSDEQREEIDALRGENNQVDRLLSRLQRRGESDDFILDKFIFALKASHQPLLIKWLRQPTPGKQDYYWEKETTGGATLAAADMDTGDGYHGDKPPDNEGATQFSFGYEKERLATGVFQTPVDAIPPPPPYEESVIEPCLQAFRRNDQSIQGSEKLEHEGFLDVNRVVMVVHGFQNDVTEAPWMHEMKDAILKEADDTVILVGWGRGANLPAHRYRDAFANTQVIGRYLATVATAIKSTRSGIPIWGIGHSLGAHVLGKAGRDSGAFCRITALDPAGPMMEMHNEDMRLHPTDAAFVDVIHTDGCAADLRAVHLGTLIPLGTIDFYPNFGLSPQPGCKGINETASHSRAWELFIWSILHKESFKTTLMLAKAPKYKEPVKDTVEGPMAQMGFYADQHAQTGLYYLPTEGTEPWEKTDTVDSAAQKPLGLLRTFTNMMRD